MIKRLVRKIHKERKFVSLFLAYYLIPTEFRSVILLFGFDYLIIRFTLMIIYSMNRDLSELIEDLEKYLLKEDEQ